MRYVARVRRAQVTGYRLHEPAPSVFIRARYGNISGTYSYAIKMPVWGISGVVSLC